MDETYRQQYQALLEEAGRFHGDVCRGIELGTRMTMRGLREIGIADPKGADRKKLIVFVEIDRCATDAIMALTGCRPGKRTMKVLDYGKMAATFVNLETGRAVRVALLGKRTDIKDEEMAMDALSDDELLSVNPVEVDLRPEDLPGRPVRTRTCARCGENIMDGREIEAGGKDLCRSCFERKTYYRPQAEARA
jgi:formylmethanofuran dehydrogenase subunit E